MISNKSCYEIREAQDKIFSMSLLETGQKLRAIDRILRYVLQETEGKLEPGAALREALSELRDCQNREEHIRAGG